MKGGKYINLQTKMGKKRHRAAEIVIETKPLIKRHLVKRESRSSGGLLVILAHGDTATAKEKK